MSRRTGCLFGVILDRFDRFSELFLWLFLWHSLQCLTAYRGRLVLRCLKRI